MPIDNILYENEFIMDIDVSSVGACSNVLYGELLGFEMTINQSHTGSAQHLLVKENQMQTFKLVAGGNTYSRSRVVNK